MEIFPEYLLLLPLFFLNFNTLGLKNTLWLTPCFVAQHSVTFWRCSMCLWKDCMFCVGSLNFLSMLLEPSAFSGLVTFSPKQGFVGSQHTHLLRNCLAVLLYDRLEKLWYRPFGLKNIKYLLSGSFWKVFSDSCILIDFLYLRVLSVTGRGLIGAPVVTGFACLFLHCHQVLLYMFGAMLLVTQFLNCRIFLWLRCCHYEVTFLFQGFQPLSEIHHPTQLRLVTVCLVCLSVLLFLTSLYLYVLRCVL